MNKPKHGLNRREIGRARRTPILQVLHRYGLIDQMFERGSAACGPSPFSVSGVLHVDLKRGSWDDTGGRPSIEGQTVEGDVVGLVQAIEGVGHGRALEILHECFVLRVRTGVSRVLSPHRPTRGIEELSDLIFDIPALRRVGVYPELARMWGGGWTSRGPLPGHIVFPVRSVEGVLVGYAGLVPGPTDRWHITDGIDPQRDLFGLSRIFLDTRTRSAAIEHGITLVDDPLEVVRTAGRTALPVVSSLTPDLTDNQVEALLDGVINPTGRLVLGGERRHAHMLAVRRRLWRLRASSHSGMM